MPFECVWWDTTPEGLFQPGWCVPLGYHLSKPYRALPEPRRPAISVCVPDRNRPGEATLFCIDAHPTGHEDDAWVVTIEGPLVHGQKPDITVTPSMHAIGIYHGWLTHGVLTDDQP